MLTIKMNFRRGQGVVESVFSVGVLILLMGGAVILIIMGISNRNASFDRRKATELANLVVESQISLSKNYPEIFWTLDNSGNSLTMAGFENYKYSVGFTNISNSTDYPNCGIGVTDCAEMVVKIDWSGKNPQSLYFNRFFSKNE